MSKYIDAEKLIAEIEWRKNESRELAQEHNNSSLGNVAQTMANEDEEILSIITSLQQEQQEVDLDAEIAIYLNRNFLNRINNSDIIEDFTTIEAGELASHFYELGLVEKENRGNFPQTSLNSQTIKGWVARDKDWMHHFFLTKPQYYEDLGEWSNGGERYLIPGELCRYIEDEPIEVELTIKPL